MLTRELADSLFKALPNGQVKWTTIRKFMLPQGQGDQAATDASAHGQQLHMFEYTGQPRSDVPDHHFDVDV